MRNHFTASKTSKNNNRQDKSAVSMETGIAKRTFAVFSAMTLAASGVGLICMNQPNSGRTSIGAAAQNDVKEAAFVPLTDEERAQTESVSGAITWTDDAAQSERPESARVRLISSNGTVADEALVTAADNWAYAFDGLPKYDEMDRPVSYHVMSDSAVDTYATELNGYDIVNSQAADGMANVAVNIIWDDNNDQDALRPDSVQVELDRTNYDAKDDTKIATLGNDTNQWSYTFTHIPQAQSDDKWFAAVHTDETTQRVYTFDIQQLGDGANRTINITCSHKPYTTTLLLRNVWHDDGTPEDIAQRPESVEMAVRNSLGGMQTYTVTADDVVNGEQWAREIVLPRFNGTTEIEYEIIQDSISAGEEGEEAEYKENYTPEHDKSADVNTEIGTDNEAERNGEIQVEEENEALPAAVQCSFRLFAQGMKAQSEASYFRLLQGDSVSDFKDAVRAEIPKLAAEVGHDAKDFIGWAHTDATGVMKTKDNGEFVYYEGAIDVDAIYDFAVKNKGNAQYVYIELCFDSPNQSVINLNLNSVAVGGSFILANVAKVTGMSVITGTQNTAATLSYPENREFPLESVNATIALGNANFVGWRPEGTKNVLTTVEEIDGYIQQCRMQNKPVSLMATWSYYHVTFRSTTAYDLNGNKINNALLKTSTGWRDYISFSPDKQLPYIECLKYGYEHKGWCLASDPTNYSSDITALIDEKYDFDTTMPDTLYPVFEPCGWTVWAYAKKNSSGNGKGEQFLIFFDPSNAIYSTAGDNSDIYIRFTDSNDEYIMINQTYENDESPAIGEFDIASINADNEHIFWKINKNAQNEVKHVKVYSMQSPGYGTIANWFSEMPNLESADLSGFDMDRVSNVTALFANDPRLREVWIPIDFSRPYLTVTDIFKGAGTENAIAVSCIEQPNTAAQIAALGHPNINWSTGNLFSLCDEQREFFALPILLANYSRSGFVVHHKTDSADKGQGRTLGDKKLVLIVHHRAKKIYGNTPSPAQIAYVNPPSDNNISNENNDSSITANATPESYGDGFAHAISGLGDAGVLILFSIILGTSAFITIATHRRKQ